MNQCPACGAVIASVNLDHRHLDYLTETGHCLMNMRVWWQVWSITKNDIVALGDTPRLAIENAMEAERERS